MNRLSLDLSYTASNTRIKSHWLTFSIFSSCFSGILLAIYQPLMGMLLSAVVFFLLIGIGTLIPSVPMKIYTIVRKLITRIRGIMRVLILFIIYYGFIWVLSFTGSKFRMDHFKKASSEWRLIDSDENKKSDYSSERFYDWILKSGDWWLIFIYPYLLLLKLYGGNEHTRSVPDDTYTLY